MTHQYQTDRENELDNLTVDYYECKAHVAELKVKIDACAGYACGWNDPMITEFRKAQSELDRIEKRIARLQ